MTGRRQACFTLLQQISVLNELRKSRRRFVNDGNEMLDTIAGYESGFRDHEDVVLTGHFLEQLFANEKRQQEQWLSCIMWTVIHLNRLHK